MAAQLTKDSIDIGIVVGDIAASLAFYRDTLGFVEAGTMPFPAGKGATMHRLMCGTTTVKLIAIPEPPAASAPGGGIAGAKGVRYWTISVANIAEVMADCEAAGVTVAVPLLELAPGVSIAIVEDPDGNLVEFLQLP